MRILSCSYPKILECTAYFPRPEETIFFKKSQVLINLLITSQQFLLYNDKSLNWFIFILGVLFFPHSPSNTNFYRLARRIIYLFIYLLINLSQFTKQNPEICNSLHCITFEFRKVIILWTLWNSSIMFMRVIFALQQMISKSLIQVLFAAILSRIVLLSIFTVIFISNTSVYGCMMQKM